MTNHILIISVFLLGLTSCLGTKKMTWGDKEYHSYFPKEKLQPLKKEIPELYKLLKKGNLLECVGCPESRIQYLYSLRLSKYLQYHQYEICKSDFLSKMDNFKLTFGSEVKLIRELNGFTSVNPNAMIYDEKSDHPAMTGWLFDSNGKMICPGEG